MKRERSGWLGLLVVPLMVLCCAGPALVAGGVGLGMGAWLGAHGAWILAAAVVVVAGGGSAWWLARRRGAESCCPPVPGQEAAEDRRLRARGPEDDEAHAPRSGSGYR